MSTLIPRLHYVSTTDTAASWSSITSALRHAAPGDTVLVGPGQYGPSRTQERFPLYVPPGVTLTGAGQDACTIDGEGSMALSFRPVCPDQSLILLGHDSRLSHLTIANSGGNGVGTEPGAHALITQNTIQQHGQHGILVSGAGDVVIMHNRFIQNGTRQFRPEIPRPAAGRQGHHIFVQGKGGMANRVLITENSMQGAFADAIALVVFFDEPDATRMQVSVWHNQIAQCERRGLTIAGSFGPSQTQVHIDIRHNDIRHCGTQAIAAQAARPLVLQRIRNATLQLHIADNTCSHTHEGIALFGGFGPAEDNLLECTIIGNHITNTATHAMRVIGGVGFGGYVALRNRVQAVIGHNHVERVGAVPILLQGGAAEAQEVVTDNTVLAHLMENTLPAWEEGAAVRLNDGLPGNAVHLAEPSQTCERIQEVAPYQA